MIRIKSRAASFISIHISRFARDCASKRAIAHQSAPFGEIKQNPNETETKTKTETETETKTETETETETETASRGKGGNSRLHYST